MVPAWFFEIPTKLIIKNATRFSLDPYIIAALIMTESAGRQYAQRYEPHFEWLFKPFKFAKDLSITRATESQAQKFSYGFCQIMGATARELGFSEPLPTLFMADKNIYYGCMYLKKQFDRYGDYHEALAAYNAGSAKRKDDGTFINQTYVDKVMGFYNQLIRG